MDAKQRQQYMQAMGIPLWVPKAEVAVDTRPAETVAASALPAQSAATQLAHELQQQLATATPPVTSAPVVQAPASQPAANTVAMGCAQMDWDALQTSVVQCQRCALSKTRTQTVFGMGNRQADWMIIGEAPGADEDRRGEPFVGKAGQLLNNMLAAVAMPRESVYIANVLKCRPPNNRDPKSDEAANCRAYLERQIELVNPALILVVGRIAAQNLLQTKEPLARLRNREHQAPLTKTPVVVTYHPAYLLRQPVDKRKAWQDLQFARQILARRHAN